MPSLTQQIRKGTFFTSLWTPAHRWSLAVAIPPQRSACRWRTSRVKNGRWRHVVSDRRWRFLPSDGPMFHQGRTAWDLFGMWLASLAGQRFVSKFEIVSSATR